MKVEVSGYAWLDRGSLTARQVSTIVSRLTIQPIQTSDVDSAKVREQIKLYRIDEARNMIGVPRGFYRALSRNRNEERALVSQGLPMRNLSTTAKSDGVYAEQDVAIEKMLGALSSSWGGAILQAQPAFGKTRVGIEVARRLGRRTLILVHQEFFLEQWKKRIEQFVPGAVVGIIQQKRKEFNLTQGGEEPDFVIALLQSLARDSGDRYPSEMYQGTFGLVIADEVHRISAASFCDIVPRFNAAYRVGLSATPRRKDGTQDVFLHHIAPVTYVAKTATMVPEIRQVRTASSLKGISRGQYVVKSENLNSAQIVNQLCLDGERNQLIVDEIVRLALAGRKIMVVSARLEHLRKLSSMASSVFAATRGASKFEPVVDYYTGEWFSGETWDKSSTKHRKGDAKLAKREQADLNIAERANVIFATAQICSEGLDVPALDVMLLTTPIGDVEQIVGRIRRHCSPSGNCERLCKWRAGECQGKSMPIVVDFVDERVPRLNAMAKRRMRYYDSMIVKEKKDDEDGGWW